MLYWPEDYSFGVTARNPADTTGAPLAPATACLRLDVTQWGGWLPSQKPGTSFTVPPGYNTLQFDMRTANAGAYHAYAESVGDTPIGLTAPFAEEAALTWQSYSIPVTAILGTITQFLKFALQDQTGKPNTLWINNVRFTAWIFSYGHARDHQRSRYTAR